jgi:hypothetical protein
MIDRRRPVLIVAWLAATALSAPAAAQEASRSAATPSARDKARDLAERGQDLLLSGQAAEALPLFVEADATFHAPTILLLRGRAEASLRRFDDAYASFTRILDEPFDDAAPTEFAEARRIAAIERAKVAADRVRVELVGYPKGTTVSVDGAARTPDLAIYLVATGPHRLLFVLPDGRTHQELVDGGAGTSVRLSAPQPEILQPPAPPPVAPLLEPRAPNELTRVPAWIGFGAGAVGLGLGATFGALALDKQSALEQACPTFRCSPGDRQLADDAGLFADVSTTSFAIGGASAVFGAIWLIVAVATDEPPQAELAPRIGFGPKGGSLEVTF